jgi:hypothetical protein
MGETAATPATFPTEMEIGGTALKATGAITASTQGSGVEVGKGKFRIVMTISAIEIASNTENYIVDIEANTRTASSTWFTIGSFGIFGAQEMQGKPDSVIGRYVLIVENPYDYQIRYTMSTAASGISTGINMTIDAYPVETNA